ncbi:hypothetical protein MIDIC_310018 [Alphaproteobacteria bacterium]
MCYSRKIENATIDRGDNEEKPKPLRHPLGVEWEDVENWNTILRLVVQQHGKQNTATGPSAPRAPRTPTTPKAAVFCAESGRLTHLFCAYPSSAPPLSSLPAMHNSPHYT